MFGQGRQTTRIFRLFANSRMATTAGGQNLTHLDMRTQLRQVLSRHEAALIAGNGEVRFLRPARVDGRVCTCLELRTTTSASPQYSADGWLSRLFLDDAWHVPIRVEQYRLRSDEAASAALVSAVTYREINWRDDLVDDQFRLEP